MQNSLYNFQITNNTLLKHILPNINNVSDKNGELYYDNKKKKCSIYNGNQLEEINSLIDISYLGIYSNPFDKRKKIEIPLKGAKINSVMSATGYLRVKLNPLGADIIKNSAKFEKTSGSDNIATITPDGYVTIINTGYITVKFTISDIYNNIITTTSSVRCELK